MNSGFGCAVCNSTARTRINDSTTTNKNKVQQHDNDSTMTAQQHSTAGCKTHCIIHNLYRLHIQDDPLVHLDLLFRSKRVELKGQTQEWIMLIGLHHIR